MSSVKFEVVKFEVVHALKYPFETQKLQWMLAVKLKAER